MNEEKITVSLNEEDVQNLINCYEKDIKYIKHLENKIDKALEILKLCNSQCAKETIEILKGEEDE